MINNPTPLRLTEGVPAKWTLTINREAEGLKFRYMVYRPDGSAGSGIRLVGVYGSNWTDSPEFEYTMRITGQVYLYVNVEDSQGNVSQYYRIFYVNTSGATSELEQKVQSVAAACLASGASTEYEKALWLHDWLVKNAYYDLTFSNYDADGVLLLGTGVCDSYSKAYQMLLTEVGIESMRCTGLGNGGSHAWNLVRMDGVWTQVDCTWDDPLVSGTESDPESGYECHDYFGLNDEAMAVDHSFEQGIKCTSLERNYSLLNHELDSEVERYEFYIVRRYLWQQIYSFALQYDENDTPWAYQLYSGDPSPSAVLLAHELAQKSWSVYGGIQVPMAYHYDPETYSLCGEIDYSGRTLVLPAGTAQVESEAFSGSDSFLAVKVTGAAAIGPRAFADCDSLIRVELPAAVSEIAPDAFAGTQDHLTIICPDGSAAAAYAESAGIPHAEN